MIDKTDKPGATSAQTNYWRSLDQLAETAEFKEIQEREFPRGASEMNNPVTRRNFLSLMGASMALAGLAGCRRPLEKIVPYVIPPENLTPGMPQYYATTMPFGVNSYGLIVESHEGRPTKIEGNKKHPSTLGASSSMIQASILNLYDPERPKQLTQRGSSRSWADFVSTWRRDYQLLSDKKGEGIVVISEPFNSPSMAKAKRAFMKTFPDAIWATYSAAGDENIYNGIEIATGKQLLPFYEYGNAAVILSLDSDFLQTESENMSAIRGFADGRRVTSEADPMNRLYIVEGYYSLTGGKSDHRLRLRSSEVPAFTVALAKELENQGLKLPVAKTLSASGEFDKKWLKVVAKDLLDNKGASLVVAGRNQPPAVHALALAINKALDNIGATVSYYSAHDADLPDSASLDKALKAIESGAASTVIMLGANPVYDAGLDPEKLNKISNSIRLSLTIDETAEQAQWMIPQTHYLEEWGDARSVSGIAGVIQPLIEPLFGGHSALETLNFLATAQEKTGYELVRETWRKTISGSNFEKKWEILLHEGVHSDSADTSTSVSTRDSKISAAVNDLPPAVKTSAGNLEISFAVGALNDGRFANNGWLQELPDPVTKLTWDNAALMSVATARLMGVKNEDVVSISSGGATLNAPAWILPGQADNEISLSVGYGRTNAGQIGTGVGVNVFPLKAKLSGAAQVSPTGETYDLASSQDHGSLEGRPIYREATLDKYKQNASFAKDKIETPEFSLWTEHTYGEGYQWGMSIDLNSCTGCNACTIACQSENNIPVVGKEEVGKGREMHWIRIDRYFTGDLDHPQMVNQPMTCVHCELAPCEQVCPVAATLHDSEGVNIMVYNRCIGTRYCSNNCPYKVRHFNFFNYTKDTPEVVKMAMNPDVTIRFRGVMEKCTYCVQRVTRVKKEAKLDGNRQVKDGEVVTACQQACPAQAIVFGNVNDPNSEVSQLKKQNRDYLPLAGLNTRPRTSFLAGLRNPNPELPATVG